ncbi:MAG: tRNA pseudouridine(38-40) synthase TruA [Candidatus Omnitrophica bacterium]|nr:tRNA pseudouridine(38-40) synthase TruA [Candidatus Omnitrophota bacterium]
MRTIKLTIEYDGTDFLGWQIQKKGPTVQHVLEGAIARLTSRETRLTGAARTDSGVHAKGQSAHFKTLSHLPARNIVLGINAYLPDSVAVVCAEEVKSSFHARISARSKRYQYRILQRPARSPLVARFSWHCPYRLNVALMRRELPALLGRHDFRSFQAADKKERSSTRRIIDISLRRRGEELLFEIEADGFLYHMVRNIVGTLVEIGRGRFKPGYMSFLLKAKNRALAGPTAPACGLSLLHVTY